MKFFRRLWLPQTLPELAAWFINFAAKLKEVAAELGVTPAQLTEIDEDRDTVVWLSAAQMEHESNSGSLRDFRDRTLFGEKQDANPVAPDYLLPAKPAVMKTRIIERLLDLVEDLEDSENFTPGIAELLRILPPAKEQISPSDWTLTIKGEVLPAMELSISFSLGEANGVRLELQYPGETVWQNLGNYPKSPVVIEVEPKTPGAAQAVKIRGRKLQGNTPVGQYSPEINLTATP